MEEELCIHYSILEATVVRLSGLNFVPSPVNLGILKVEETADFILPPPGIGVFASPNELVGTGEEIGYNIIRYPVEVIFRLREEGNVGTLPLGTQTDLIGRDYSTKRGLLWRQMIRNRLHRKPYQLIEAGASPTVCEIDWMPREIIRPRVLNEQLLWESRLLFYVRSDERQTDD